MLKCLKILGDTMDTFNNINWNTLILNEWKNSRWAKEKDLETFWDSRAEHFKGILNSPASSDYANLIVEFICSVSRLEPKNTILDIGCGTGILTFPFSKLAKKITALDISKEMLMIVSDYIKTRKIDNIKIVNKRWMTAKNLSKHDIVVSHRSLGVSAHTENEQPEYSACLQKMNKCEKAILEEFRQLEKKKVYKKLLKEFKNDEKMVKRLKELQSKEPTI